MAEFNEPGVTDWKVVINGIHSKTKFEYYRSVPQFKKTIFGLMVILVLTAWGANLSAICDVLPTINGVTHKIPIQTTEVANYGVMTGNTPCNSREAIQGEEAMQGEEQLYYPLPWIPASDDPISPSLQWGTRLPCALLHRSPGGHCQPSTQLKICKANDAGRDKTLTTEAQMRPEPTMATSSDEGPPRKRRGAFLPRADLENSSPEDEEGDGAGGKPGDRKQKKTNGRTLKGSSATGKKSRSKPPPTGRGDGYKGTNGKDGGRDPWPSSPAGPPPRRQGAAEASSAGGGIPSRRLATPTARWRPSLAQAEAQRRLTGPLDPRRRRHEEARLAR
ncbi:hypothetical protein THAOC_15189, partial [Thalassiosira oceanica]